ncbi:MAG TPA: trypsin-like peptidase domain-containing protein [Candidatus Binatus sp.]|nr:trypsin-like peptidase domain-containing protein [Candidatus Binatus sp.]
MSRLKEMSGRGIGFAAAALLAVMLAACGASASSPAASTTSSSFKLQSEYVKLVQDVGPSVVLIETSVGLGSGIIYDAQGDIVTNNHVVTGSTTFMVITSTGKQYPATLVGAYPPDDLAVIRIQATGLHPATFANSSNVQVGDIVMAIGNPLGLQSSVTEGIVSAMRTAIPEGNGVTLPSAIQTTAAINPGNSGGALINLNEQVVGIPTLAATDPQLGGGAAPGIGFAISSNTVTLIANQLIKTGTVANSGRAALGAQVANTGGSGALVTTVKSGGPAALAGIKVGDTIKAIGGQSVTGAQAVADVLLALKPGQQVPVNLVHSDGSTGVVTVTLTELQ